MKKFFSEFKEFAMRGNVVDMAVGVIIGAAFGKIVSSLVNDIIMPLIGVVTGGMNFTDYKLVVQKAVMDGQEIIKPEVTMNWGAWVQTVVDFLIVAFCIFVMIKFIASGSRTHKRGAVACRDTRPSERATEKIAVAGIIKNIVADAGN